MKEAFEFLPVSKEDMESRGWWWYDFLLVTGEELAVMGKDKEKLHAGVGAYASQKGVDLLITVGELSLNTSRGAVGIMTAHFNTNADAIKALPELIKKGDTVLVKASNYMRFDEISEAIKKLTE